MIEWGHTVRCARPELVVGYHHHNPTATRQQDALERRVRWIEGGHPLEYRRRAGTEKTAVDVHLLDGENGSGINAAPDLRVDQTTHQMEPQVEPIRQHGRNGSRVGGYGQFQAWQYLS